MPALMQQTVSRKGRPTQAVDAVAPTLGAHSIPSAGTTVVMPFSEAVFGTPSLGWTITPSGGAATFTGGSGSGTGELTLTLSRTIDEGETYTVSYVAATGNLADAANNDLANITNNAGTNNSTQGGGDPPGTEVLETSFEGSGSDDWGTPIEGDLFATGVGGSFVSGLQTRPASDFSTTAPDGSRVLWQAWHDQSLVYNGPEWLHYDFETPLTHGDVVEIEFDLFYGPDFPFSGGEIIKGFGLAENGGGFQYWNTHWFGPMQISQSIHVTDWQILGANVNGGDHEVPVGTWTNYRLQQKVAREGQAQNGYIKIWVNGTLRFDYTNIHTTGSGEEITYTVWEGVYNHAVYSMNSYRLIDNLIIRVN